MSLEDLNNELKKELDFLQQFHVKIIELFQKKKGEFLSIIEQNHYEFEKFRLVIEEFDSDKNKILDMIHEKELGLMELLDSSKFGNLYDSLNCTKYTISNSLVNYSYFFI